MKCKNCEGKYYTGKENTPLGKGYSASVEKVGKRMKGRDGNMYEVVKSGKGKRWLKVTSKRKTSPRMFDEKIWEDMEKIQLTPTDHAIIGGKRYVKGTYSKGYEVKEVYKYTDDICGVSADVVDVVPDNSSRRNYISLEWKGKTPENNQECRESSKIISVLYKYFENEGMQRHADILKIIGSSYRSKYDVKSYREDIRDPMNTYYFDSITDEDL